MSKKNKINLDNDPSSIPPVGWYDPAQLWDTATHVTESDTFTRNADRRITYTEWEEKNDKDGNRHGPKPIEFNINGSQYEDENIFSIGRNRNNGEEAIWIDFVADTGDGGNATYTVAKTLFVDSLAITYHHELLQPDNPIRKRFPKGLPETLPRADLLILGGDLVYPVASERGYEERFRDLFKAALPITEDDRKEIDNQELDSDANKHSDYYRAVIAFPQNHDWYDNLSSFTLLFSHKEKETFLDMKCPQSQSYAAVKLPNDWWLFGFDFALTDDIDAFQFEYFKKIINSDKGLDKNSRIIIEYCEPVWRTTALGWREKVLGKDKNTAWSYRYEELESIIEEKTDQAIDIRIAGDQHHYRRYSSKADKNNTNKSQSHLITCGSGGAFLHPTHGPADFETIHHILKKDGSLRTYTFSNEEFNDLEPGEKTEYQKKQDYPSCEESEILSWKNFCFLGLNPWFGLITAISYFLIVWANFSSLFSNIKTADFAITKTNHFEEICYQQPIQWHHNDFSWFENLSCSWRLWSWSTILSPLNAFIMIFVIFGFWYFAKEFNLHAKKWAGILGILHGCTHFFAIFLIYFLVLSYLDRDPIQAPLEFKYYFITGVWIFLFGWILGSTIMGSYLFFTLNLYRGWVAILASIITLIFSYCIFAMWFNPFASIFIITSAAILVAFIWYKGISILEEDSNNDLLKRLANFCSPIKDFVFNLKKEILFLHSNEAFSSLSEQKYKGFLRFKITPERLEAFFIGIDEIPEMWEKEESTKAAPKWKETDKNIIPKLVDYWTVETPPKSNKQSS